MRCFVPIVLATAAALGACASRTRPAPAPLPQMVTAPLAVPLEPEGTLAQIYYWRAKPGKFEEYSRYIREIAEPIDHDAGHRGAFVSVNTFVARDTASAWTHMRVFILRDSAQLRALSGALDAAGQRLEPDSAKRRVRGEYSATLRDRVGAVTAEILR